MSITSGNCPECGYDDFKKDYKTGEGYCSKCGYIPYDPFSMNYIGLIPVKKEDGDTKLAPTTQKK